MLTESLGSRAGMLLEVENGLHSIAEISRYFCACKFPLNLLLTCVGNVSQLIVKITFKVI